MWHNRRDCGSRSGSGFMSFIFLHVISNNKVNVSCANTKTTTTATTTITTTTNNNNNLT
jgi:hypothetical protein